MKLLSTYALIGGLFLFGYEAQAQQTKEDIKDTLNMLYTDAGGTMDTIVPHKQKGSRFEVYGSHYNHRGIGDRSIEPLAYSPKIPISGYDLNMLATASLNKLSGNITMTITDGPYSKYLLGESYFPLIQQFLFNGTYRISDDINASIKGGRMNAPIGHDGVITNHNTLHSSTKLSTIATPCTYDAMLYTLSIKKHSFMYMYSLGFGNRIEQGSDNKGHMGIYKYISDAKGGWIGYGQFSNHQSQENIQYFSIGWGLGPYNKRNTNALQFQGDYIMSSGVINKRLLIISMTFEKDLKDILLATGWSLGIGFEYKNNSSDGEIMKKTIEISKDIGSRISVVLGVQHILKHNDNQLIPTLVLFKKI